MKKLGLLLAAMVLISIGTMAQKAEVLYFKAELPCCPGRACNALEADIKSFIENNFKDGSVTYKQVRIADEANSELVQKHNARSQTVVVVLNESNTTVDLSAIVRKHSRGRNKAEFEGELITKINESIK